MPLVGVEKVTLEQTAREIAESIIELAHYYEHVVALHEGFPTCLDCKGLVEKITTALLTARTDALESQEVCDVVDALDYFMRAAEPEQNGVALIPARGRAKAALLNYRALPRDGAEDSEGNG